MATRDVTADPGGADITRRSGGGLAAAAQRLLKSGVRDPYWSERRDRNADH
jgi:hypothetical protein